MTANRRDFIKFVVAGTITASCPIESVLLNGQSEHAELVEGEDNRICHQVRDGLDFPRPSASARHDVVIVGGGISGLSATYKLRHFDCLLLEKEPHWGGNAYMMDYRGTSYATGSAFVSGDDEAALALVREIGLDSFPINNWDGTIIRGEYIPDTWGEGIDRLPFSTSVREGFKQFKRTMLRIDLRERSDELFRVPFSQLTKVFPVEVKLWWDAYGRSNWGATSEDTPAAVAIGELQTFAADNRKDARVTWPGGNGELTKRLVELLIPALGPNMQTGASTIAVVPDKDDVLVTYLQNGELKTVAAKAVIVALPKLMARRIVHGLPEKQSLAMNQIRYIPYLVVNLIFEKQIFNRGYDTWCPGNTFTDFIVADWVLRNRRDYRPTSNILTCYVPMHEEDRAYLLTESGARKVAFNVLRDFQRLLPGSGVDPVEVHVYRRGHPLFMSTLGLYKDIQPLARRPIDRISFANSDSEGPQPTIGGAVAAGFRSAKEVQDQLSGKQVGA
jgi:protoporphyrinogen oxidase